MAFILASGSPLPELGQIAAIIILVYMFFLIVIGAAIAVVLALCMQWVREKAELIKRLRPTVDSVNTTTKAAEAGKLPPADDSNKVVRTIAEVPVYVKTIDDKVEQGSERVAEAVIEFRARAMMATQMLKAFFLPGLKPRARTSLEEEGVGFRSPGYTALIEEQPAGDAGAMHTSQIKDAPEEVAATASRESRIIPAPAQRQDASSR
jgi:hypothetical protein